MINSNNLIKNYEVARYDFIKLIRLGKIENHTLVCDENAIVHSEIRHYGARDLKGNCQLFDQFLKAYPSYVKKENQETTFNHIFINIDFTKFIEAKQLDLEELLKKIEQGIVFKYSNQEVRFVDFLKSNSMSKNSCLYFINSDYLEFANKRILFNLLESNPKVCTPKWYAYSGLILSDTIILDDVHFDEGEIVVVDDSKELTNCTCTTAISVKYLFERIKSLKEIVDNTSINNFNALIKKDSEVKTIFDEFDAYNQSKDCEMLFHDSNPNSLREVNERAMHTIIKETKGLKNLSIDQFETYYSMIEKTIEEFETRQKELSDYNNEIYWAKIEVQRFPIKVNKFDGEGLLSFEFREEIINSLTSKNKEDAYFGNSFQIRLPFIKGVIHACDLKEFFKEHDVKTIKGLTFNEDNPFKEYDADKIKVIITKSQFKLAKLFKEQSQIYQDEPSKFDYFIRLLKSYDYSLGVELEYGLDKPKSNRINLNYQFMSTIPFDEAQLANLVDDNIRELNRRIDDDRLIDDMMSKYQRLSEEERKEYYYSSDCKLIEANKTFYLSTERFKSIKKREYNSSINDLYMMKLITNGYRKYLCGDLLELLYHACYQNDLPECFKELNKTQFYSPNLKLFETKKHSPFMLLRNPHYSNREICLLYSYKKIENDERVRYFSHLTGVLMVNPMSFAAERLGGADYDGDQVVLLNDKYRDNYIDGLKNHNEFVKIPSLTSGREIFNYDNKIRCLKNTFTSRVGQISNCALNKMFKLNGEGNLDDKDNDISLYTILCGLEIDSVKNGAKPHLSLSGKDQAASFFLKLKDRLVDNNTVTKNDKLRFEKGQDINNIFKTATLLSKKKINLQGHKYQELDIDPVNLNQDAMMKLIVAKIIYDELTHYQIDNTASISNVYDNILGILEDDPKLKYEVDDFIDSFDGYDIDSILNKYCNSDKKFYYCTTKEERLDYLVNYLNIDIATIPQEYVDRVCSFENNGIYLLYYILVILNYRHRVNDKDSYERIDYKKASIQRKLDNLYNFSNRNYLREVELSELEYMLKQEVKVINQIMNKDEKYQKLLARAKQELSTYLSDVPFDNYLYFRETSKDDKIALNGNPGTSFVLDTMIDQLIEHLELGGNKVE